MFILIPFSQKEFLNNWLNRNLIGPVNVFASVDNLRRYVRTINIENVKNYVVFDANKKKLHRLEADIDLVQVD